MGGVLWGERVEGRGQGGGAVRYQTPLSNPVSGWDQESDRLESLMRRKPQDQEQEEERGRTGPLRPGAAT